MNPGVFLAIGGVCLLHLLVGMAFGGALGLRHAEPRHRNALLHEGEWGMVSQLGRMVVWQRQGDRRKRCEGNHRAYVCTILANTEHVDACDCGATRSGVYGAWC